MAPVRTLRFLLPRVPEARDAAAESDEHPTAGTKRRRMQTLAADAGSATGDGDLAATQYVDVRLVELIGEVSSAPPTGQQHYGLFVWPSALALAHLIASERRLLLDKVVMELGCGTGLPGILAARLDATDTRRNVEANIALNRLDGVAEFLPLNWGDMFVSERLLGVLATVDLVLAADCFYNPKDFEKVIATVALIFRCNPQSRLITTYQLRSISRSIAPLLARWQMSARSIDKSSFLPLNSQEGAFESVFAYEIQPLGCADR